MCLATIALPTDKTRVPEKLPFSNLFLGHELREESLEWQAPSNSSIPGLHHLALNHVRYIFPSGRQIKAKDEAEIHYESFEWLPQSEDKRSVSCYRFYHSRIEEPLMFLSACGHHESLPAVELKGIINVNAVRTLGRYKNIWNTHRPISV